MIHKLLPSYLVADRINSEAIIIDPVNTKIEQYMKLLKEFNLKLKFVFDTHVHADHITAAGKLRELTNCITLLGESTGANCVSKTVCDGEKNSSREYRVYCIRNSGHTQDSFCLYTPGMVFTGDTFILSEEQEEQIFKQVIQSISTIVSSTSYLHCQKKNYCLSRHDYNGNTCTTIWEEKILIHAWQVKTVEEFKYIMDNLNLPNPKLMDVAVPANLALWISIATPLVARLN